jgi:hypothetical protein
MLFVLIGKIAGYEKKRERLQVLEAETVNDKND